MQRVEAALPSQTHFKLKLKSKKVYCLPESYLHGFEDKLFVITTKDLKNPANQALAELQASKWLLQPSDENDFSSMVADLKRPLRIMVEMGEGDSYHLQTAYDISRLNYNDAEKEALAELSDHDYLQHLYYDGIANLQKYEASHGFSFEKFKNVAKAYMQQHLYLIKNIIQGGISDRHIIGEFSVRSDVVILRDGTVALDLYQPVCSIVCTDIQDKGEFLRAPCPSQVFIRIPYLAEQKQFGNPIIFCNELFLPFVFSNQSVLLQNKPSELGAEQQAALETAIAHELKKKSDGAEKVKRQATKGRHAIKVILATAGLIGVAAVATIFLIPAGPGAVVALVGLAAADGAVSTGLSIGAAFAVFGIGTVTGAGLSSTIYFTCRAVIPRNLEHIDLSIARVDTVDLIHTVLPLLVHDDLEGFVSLEKPDARAREERSPPSSPKFFDSRAASPQLGNDEDEHHNDKGKEEAFKTPPNKI